MNEKMDGQNFRQMKGRTERQSERHEDINKESNKWNDRQMNRLMTDEED